MDAEVLVTRFAFDLELTVLAQHFGYGQGFDSPVRIDDKVQSTTSPRAVFQVPWDTLTNHRRLRILNWHIRAEPRGRSLLLEELPATLGGD